MHCIETKDLNVCVTPNHNMFVKPLNSHEYVEARADSLVGRYQYKKNISGWKGHIGTIDIDCNMLKYNQEEVRNFIVNGELIDANSWLKRQHNLLVA